MGATRPQNLLIIAAGKYVAPFRGHYIGCLHVRGLATDAPGREVPNVTDINCDVPTAVVTAAVVTTAAWSARAGASGPRLAFPGTSVPGAGTGPVGLVRPV